MGFVTPFDKRPFPLPECPDLRLSQGLFTHINSVWSGSHSRSIEHFFDLLSSMPSVHKRTRRASPTLLRRDRWCLHGNVFLASFTFCSLLAHTLQISFKLHLNRQVSISVNVRIQLKLTILACSSSLLNIEYGVGGAVAFLSPNAACWKTSFMISWLRLYRVRARVRVEIESRSSMSR